ncbi:hypothetical protein [Sphingomonas sp. DC1100-1]|uniref:hypothetical protein n=1 Tax=unclassified Sphingomonas TaxID=196159 RepID=UPI003CF07418
MTDNKGNADIAVLKAGDIVLIRGRVERIIEKKEIRSKEGKGARAAAIIRYKEIVIGVPFYTTGGGRPEREWIGGGRYLIAGTAQNGLKNVFPQLGIDNACILEQENLLKPIGKLDEVDREILVDRFWDQLGRDVEKL